MTDGSQRAALGAVHSARPIVARLSIARHKEDLAADIIEAWDAVEVALRSLVGGSALAGQALIRELRQRNFLSFDQANSLAEFHAARERAGRTDYAPTDSDVNAARDAFLKLEAGLMGESEAMRSPAAGGVAAASPPPVPPATTTTSTSSAVKGRRPAWMAPAIGLASLLIVGGLAWWALAGHAGSNADYDQGVQAYREGRREAAEALFRKAAGDAPTDPMPHAYLSRMERERGNLGNANAEAVTAVRLGPGNATALRELASTLFAAHQFDDARKFYLRALIVDSNDRLSQGFLGCSLIRLGRIDEGQRWINRAGTGAWSVCAPAPAGVPPQQVPMTGVPRP
jgi:Flp pilus assembly protein TadD